GVVGEHAMAADDAVVRDMRIGEEPVVVADAGAAAAVAGAAVDGGELADDVAVADLEPDALAAVLLVLRLAADRGMAVEMVVAADAGGAVDAAMRADAGAVADLDIGTDVGEGADRNAITQPRGGIDDRVGVDQARHV